MARMLLQTIEQIGREKNIAPEVIVDAVEEAMAVASKKYYKTEEELKAVLNRDTGDLEVYAIKEVVEEVEDDVLEIDLEEARAHDADVEIGDFVEIPRSTEELGRIAAQAAKQVIFQKVRDAERENIYNEFIERVGELVTGIVKRFERGDMMVDLGRTEGMVPRREQSRAEHYNIGDRIRVVITDVLQVSRGPQIVLSRVHPELLIRLFEMEVPEIYDGTVVIKGCVREGGDRAKVAVHSLEADVDPVGACVGMRGSRVQSIIRELRGEKIDIVQWSPDLKQYTINSLKPARVNRVNVLDEEDEEGNRLLEVVVDEDQLSLAIGRRGQNVRLAGKLLGCRIDIKSEEDKKKEVEQTLARMARREEPVEILAPLVSGVGPSTVEALEETGFETVGAVVDADLDTLTDVPGIGPKTAEKLREAAAETLQSAPEEVAVDVDSLPADLRADVSPSELAATIEADPESAAVLASMTETRPRAEVEDADAGEEAAAGAEDEEEPADAAEQIERAKEAEAAGQAPPRPAAPEETPAPRTTMRKITAAELLSDRDSRPAAATASVDEDAGADEPSDAGDDASAGDAPDEAPDEVAAEAEEEETPKEETAEEETAEEEAAEEEAAEEEAAEEEAAEEEALEAETAGQSTGEEDQKGEDEPTEEAEPAREPELA